MGEGASRRRSPETRENREDCTEQEFHTQDNPTLLPRSSQPSTLGLTKGPRVLDGMSTRRTGPFSTRGSCPPTQLHGLRRRDDNRRTSARKQTIGCSR